MSNNVDQTINLLKNDKAFMKNCKLWLKYDSINGNLVDYPSNIFPDLKKTYQKKGIKQLYSHQAKTFELTKKENNIIIVTPTASGKTTCYNLPVLNALCQNKTKRALYLFPTKALAQDQFLELNTLITELNQGISVATYDGDTPTSSRKKIRENANIIISNPDMLHAGILPHHTAWENFFENLDFIIVDELHYYKGVFGSHVANIMRRLKRICTFYNSYPQFICCSATINNPLQHAENLFEEKFELISENGAPRGEKNYVIYNPPTLNEQTGLKASSVKTAAQIGSNFINKGLATIIFARSRTRVEIVSKYLQEKCPLKKISPYRGGYLPQQRRDIEKGLKEKKIEGVVSTNALELGVDIGMLDVAITIGYPGSVSSVQQQFGRAGRRGSNSLAILITTGNPLDQYIANNPLFIMGNNPENATINQNNLLILLDHLKCAAFELPFTEGESFAKDLPNTKEMLDFLAGQGLLKKVSQHYHWLSGIYPATEVSLRSSSQENFVIIDSEEKKVIGEIDFFSVPTTIYQGAIYLHQGQQYQIEKLDYETKRAYGHAVESDFYTLAEEENFIQKIQEDLQMSRDSFTVYLGEISIRTLAVMYKKIKFNTHENIGTGKISLPENEMHTTAIWLEFEEYFFEEITSSTEIQNLLDCTAYLFKNLAPVFTLADYTDIKVIAEKRSKMSRKATLLIYDTVPGGVGIAPQIYQQLSKLISESILTIEKCNCKNGCPACIGPNSFQKNNFKILVKNFLKAIIYGL